jgi:hypothetical protein
VIDSLESTSDCATVVSFVSVDKCPQYLALYGNRVELELVIMWLDLENCVSNRRNQALADFRWEGPQAKWAKSSSNS